MEGHHVEMIVDDLHQKRGVSFNTIMNDLSSFIDRLVVEGIIETCR